MQTAEPTAEMIAFFEQRTWEHIQRVRRYLELLAGVTDHAIELRQRAHLHDMSKFEEPERLGYIWITDYYRHHRRGHKYQYPAGVQPIAEAAKLHHYRTNRHHIEFHASPADMTDVDLMEMVCDWTAMSQEFDEPNASAYGWARKVLSTRWKFPKPRELFIMETIRLLDNQG